MGNCLGNDAYGLYWRVPTSTTLFRGLMPGVEGASKALAANGINIDLESGKGFWEYPEDLRIFGVSAATNLFGWSTSAEFSYQENIPLMVNGNDLIAAGVLGIGPYRDQAAEVQAQSAGTYLIGHKRFTKRQFQANFVKTFSNFIGAETLLWWARWARSGTTCPTTPRGHPLRRGFMYGTASSAATVRAAASGGQPTLGGASLGNTCSPTFVGLPVPVFNTLYNPQPIGCKNDGFVTDFAWGYRLRVSMDYNNVLNSGVTVTPSVFWLHDVEGVSMDPAFNEDRKTLGLGVRFNLNKKYLVDLNYVDYDDENFDPLFDRDYYSASFSVTF